MKKILALILTALMLCGMLAPSVLAVEEPSAETETTDTVTDSGSGADTDGSIDTATPSDAGTVTDDEKLTSTDEITDAPGETEDSSVPDDFDYTGSIISYTTPDAFTGTFNMDCGDTGFTQLHNALDSVSISGTAEMDGSSYSLTLSVTWDFSTVDAETPGNYTAVGSISIPEGATLSDGLENTISISVQVTAPVLTVSPSAITLTRFDEPDRTDAVAFAAHTSQKELSKWFADSVAGFTGYDANGNPYDLVSGAWSLDAVDTGTPGVYYASVTPDLGTEYTLADGVSLPRQLCAVSIQKPGEPDINCCVSGRGFLHFPWVLSADQQEQIDEFAVWLRQDSGEWSQLSDGFLFTSEDLQLSQRILTYRSTYELKVAYPGGQTGVLSFQYDGELSILDYSEGDRDGGDINGGGSGSGTQPSPTSPQTPSDSHEDNNHGSGNNMPTQDNSSSTSNEISTGLASSSKESQEVPSSSNEPDEEQVPSPGEIHPALTSPQTSGSSQNTKNHNSNNNSLIQPPVTDEPASGTYADSTEPVAPVYSNTFFSLKTKGTLSFLGNHAVPKDNAKEVLTQPKKISESQEPAVVSESYSPTQTVISGLRLRDLCADAESVMFGSGDLTVSIPSNLLLALNLSDLDTLSVGLTQPENNKIMLMVEACGKSVTKLTRTVLRLRYLPQLKSSEITVRNEAGELIEDAAYDGEFLRFTADKAETYTILEVSKAQEAQKGVSPLLPVSGGLILATGGIVFFRRRRHG